MSAAEAQPASTRPRSWRLAGLALVWLALSAVAAHAQTLVPTLWITDGDVFSVVRSGNTIYVGGVFTTVGPSTGGGVPLDGNTGLGAVGADYPKVLGTVYTAAPDGSGGWYIGGLFTAVGGQLRNNAAHILADNSVSAWNPNPDDRVQSIVVAQGKV